MASFGLELSFDSFSSLLSELFALYFTFVQFDWTKENYLSSSLACEYFDPLVLEKTICTSWTNLELRSICLGNPADFVREPLALGSFKPGAQSIFSRLGLMICFVLRFFFVKSYLVRTPNIAELVSPLHLREYL